MFSAYLCNVRSESREQILNISEDDESERERENIQGQKDSEGTWSPHCLGMPEAHEEC